MNLSILLLIRRTVMMMMDVMMMMIMTMRRMTMNVTMMMMLCVMMTFCVSFSFIREAPSCHPVRKASCAWRVVRRQVWVGPPVPPRRAVVHLMLYNRARAGCSRCARSKKDVQKHLV